MEKINPEEFNAIPTPFRPLLRVVPFFVPFRPYLWQSLFLPECTSVLRLCHSFLLSRFSFCLEQLGRPGYTARNITFDGSTSWSVNPLFICYSLRNDPSI